MKNYMNIRMTAGTLMTFIMLLLLNATPLHAQSSDFTLSANGDTLIKYNGPGGNVTIPSGIKVIGESAFGSNSDYNTTLTGVVIPEGVTTIGNRAFMQCTALTSVNIPNSVTTIGYFAFSYCTSLTSVTIPNSVTNIGTEYSSGLYSDYIFSSCTGLTEAIVGDGVPRIDRMFYGCSALRTLVVGAKMQTFERQPFANLRSPNLETLIIRNPQPPTITNPQTLPSTLPATRRLYTCIGSETNWNTDTNGWKEWATQTIADIPIHPQATIRDTLHPNRTTILDTTYHLHILEQRDTTYLDTTIHATQHDTLHYPPDTLTDTAWTITHLTLHDTTRLDTPLHLPPTHDTIRLIRDTLHHTLTIRDTLTHTDTLTTTDTTHQTITLQPTPDTLHHTTNATDTTTTLLIDTTHHPIHTYDTTHTTTTIPDPTLPPTHLTHHDTLITTHTDTINHFLLINPNDNTSAHISPTPTPQARDTEGGVLLENLTPGQPLTIYSLEGRLLHHTTAPIDGIYLLRFLSPGTYLLHHPPHHAKFSHN